MAVQLKDVNDTIERRQACQHCIDANQAISEKMSSFEKRLDRIEEQFEIHQDTIEAALNKIQLDGLRFQSEVNMKFVLWDTWKNAEEIRSKETNTDVKLIKESLTELLLKQSEQKGFFMASKLIGGFVLSALGALVAIIASNFEKIFN